MQDQRKREHPRALRRVEPSAISSQREHIAISPHSGGHARGQNPIPPWRIGIAPADRRSGTRAGGPEEGRWPNQSATRAANRHYESMALCAVSACGDLRGFGVCGFGFLVWRYVEDGMID
jgi:hypothetical protein